MDKDGWLRCAATHYDGRVVVQPADGCPYGLGICVSRGMLSETTRREDRCIHFKRIAAFGNVVVCRKAMENAVLER